MSRANKIIFVFVLLLSTCFMGFAIAGPIRHAVKGGQHILGKAAKVSKVCRFGQCR